VLTSNLAFSEWTGIFPNGACATALIDRIIHHADIITIEGQSDRREGRMCPGPSLKNGESRV
jgi:DNA replication protein DnaC